MFDVSWVVSDLILFGEYVPTFENTTLLSINNETPNEEGLMSSVFKELLGEPVSFSGDN
jgi:hypothetical protein